MLRLGFGLAPGPVAIGDEVRQRSVEFDRAVQPGQCLGEAPAPVRDARRLGQDRSVVGETLERDGDDVGRDARFAEFAEIGGDPRVAHRIVRGGRERLLPADDRRAVARGIVRAEGVLLEQRRIAGRGGERQREHVVGLDEAALGHDQFRAAGDIHAFGIKASARATPKKRAQPRVSAKAAGSLPRDLPGDRPRLDGPVADAQRVRRLDNAPNRQTADAAALRKLRAHPDRLPGPAPVEIGRLAVKPRQIEMEVEAAPRKPMLDLDHDRGDDQGSRRDGQIDIRGRQDLIAAGAADLHARLTGAVNPASRDTPYPLEGRPGFAHAMQPPEDADPAGEIDRLVQREALEAAYVAAPQAVVDLLDRAGFVEAIGLDHPQQRVSRRQIERSVKAPDVGDAFGTLPHVNLLGVRHVLEEAILEVCEDLQPFLSQAFFVRRFERDARVGSEVVVISAANEIFGRRFIVGKQDVVRCEQLRSASLDDVDQVVEPGATEPKETQGFGAAASLNHARFAIVAEHLESAGEFVEGEKALV